MAHLPHRPLTLCLLLAAAASAGAQELTRIPAVRALSGAQAAESRPVRLTGQVLVFDSWTGSGGQMHEFFLHDGQVGIYVEATSPAEIFRAGEMLEITGVTRRGFFAPVIMPQHIRRVGSSALPAAPVIGLQDALSGRHDCDWVSLRGIVRRDYLQDDRRRLTLMVEGHRVAVAFSGPAPAAYPRLVGASVSVPGAVSGIFNENAQMTDIRALQCPDAALVQILQQAPASAALKPLSYDQVQGADPAQPAKIQGTLSAQRMGEAVFLTDGIHAAQVRSKEWLRFAIGDQIEAVGFPLAKGAPALLEDAEFRRIGTGSAPVPQPIAPEQLADATLASRLVRLHAIVKDHGITPAPMNEHWLLLQAGDTLLAAHFPPGEGGLETAPHPGDEIRLTGILAAPGEPLPKTTPPALLRASTHLLLRGPQDITALSWWTQGRVLSLLAAVISLVLVLLGWTYLLRRQVRAQTATIEAQTRHAATLDERQRIARELHDTLAQGFAGTTFALEGITSQLDDPAHDKLKTQLDLALRMARHGLTEARRSVMNLRTDALEHLALPAALEQAARQLLTGTSVTLTTHFDTENLPPLPADIESDLFRIGVEALSNAVRHAKPTTIHLHLQHDAQSLTLRVQDDGSGFDPQSASQLTGHFGLLGMKERARQIGAQLSIQSQPGTGTHLTLTLPLPHPPSPPHA